LKDGILPMRASCEAAKTPVRALCEMSGPAIFFVPVFERSVFFRQKVV